MTARDLASTLSTTVSGLGTTVRVLGRAGVIRPYGPRTLANIGLVVARWGTGPAGGFATLAARSPHQVGIVDELGELTWGELHRRSNSLARALAERGVQEGDSVAVMCRNHRGFVDASIAVAKLGADILYLNTAFSGTQLGEVCEREKPAAIVYDEELTELIEKSGIDLPKEFVKGLCSAKYANAVILEEGMYRLHIAPLLEMICEALTRVYQALLASFVRPA